MCNLRKRGQYQSHFVFWLILLIIAALFFFLGYKTIGYIGEKGEEALLINFEHKLEADVKSVGYEKGSVKVGKYYPSSSFDEVCFVDLKNIDTADIDEYPIIKESVESGDKKNLFFIGKKNFKALYIEDLQLFYYPYFLCIKPRTPSTELTIVGLSDGAAIKEADRTYCRNAQDGGLCAGLDIVFGSGYREKCCVSYNFCCI